MILAAVEHPLIERESAGEYQVLELVALCYLSTSSYRPKPSALVCLNILFCWFLMPGACVCNCRGTVSTNRCGLHEPKIARRECGTPFKSSYDPWTCARAAGLTEAVLLYAWANLSIH